MATKAASRYCAGTKRGMSSGSPREGDFHVPPDDDKALLVADAGAQQRREQLRQSEEVRGRGKQGDKGPVGP